MSPQRYPYDSKTSGLLIQRALPRETIYTFVSFEARMSVSSGKEVGAANTAEDAPTTMHSVISTVFAKGGCLIEVGGLC